MYIIRNGYIFLGGLKTDFKKYICMDIKYIGLFYSVLGGLSPEKNSYYCNKETELESLDYCGLR